jgi:hypothetical protein
MEVSALFLTLRRRATGEAVTAGARVNLSYPYFALCLLSAAAVNDRSGWFYPGLCVLLAWPLWVARPRRFSPLLWVSLLAGGCFLGHAGHLGLHRLQAVVERQVVAWNVERLRNDPGPYPRSTAVGEPGASRGSRRIVLRVKPGEGANPPMLLRAASYNVFNALRWFDVKCDWHPVAEGPAQAAWRLGWHGAAERTITVFSYLEAGRGLLALPEGAFLIERLPVAGMHRNLLGAIKVEGGPGLVGYRISAARDVSLDSPPTESDLRVPRADAAALSGLARELGLASASPQQVLEIVKRFFRDSFTYSLPSGDGGRRRASVREFLFRSREGHCEYFATAAVLLLRTAGIPARYATGYTVQEFSRLEHMYVVRERHAHAWALVCIDGRWRDFDTTPPGSGPDGTAGVGLWASLRDLWSRCQFVFSKWRWSTSEGAGARRAVWFLVPLAALLVWRLCLKKRVPGFSRTGGQQQAASPVPGTDSEFYLIEARLDQLGFRRHRWESLSRWLERIEAQASLSVSTEPLHALLVLHYRYRFDPDGVTERERSALRSRAQSWLEQHRT